MTSARHQVLKQFTRINGDADTWGMLADPHPLSGIITGLTELARPAQPDLILGIEARGFALGPAVAAAPAWASFRFVKKVGCSRAT